MHRLRALPIALALLATTAGATAESSYSLSYRAADGCPTREDFIAELGARSPNLREATNGAPDVSIEIWFEGHEPTHGILLLRDAEGRPTLRTIPGATCQEVVAALALTASLLTDAQRQAGPVPAAPPAAESPAPPAKPATTADPVIQSPTADSQDEGSENPADADQSSTLRFHVGMGAAVEQGVAPSVAFAGALELGVEWRRPYPLEPLISVTLERTLTETLEEPQGDARFRWTALRLGFCPFRLVSDGPFVGTMSSTGGLSGSVTTHGGNESYLLYLTPQ
jgi:hypothetical protein